MQNDDPVTADPAPDGRPHPDEPAAVTWATRTRDWRPYMTVCAALVAAAAVAGAFTVESGESLSRGSSGDAPTGVELQRPYGAHALALTLEPPRVRAGSGRRAGGDSPARRRADKALVRQGRDAAGRDRPDVPQSGLWRGPTAPAPVPRAQEGRDRSRDLQARRQARAKRAAAKRAARAKAAVTPRARPSTGIGTGAVGPHPPSVPVVPPAGTEVCGAIPMTGWTYPYCDVIPGAGAYGRLLEGIFKFATPSAPPPAAPPEASSEAPAEETAKTTEKPEKPAKKSPERRAGKKKD
ncbi:hypothetical protein ACFFMN_07155 [Planobispora siamensis]|uniref:Uncharacterized protein n=1 Tax=Planobispora siamensis TaxID=936338 RepID=A0A8J3SLJ9_9ACTN|nr:hypothetical protein [Planobispora siamensis]GIH95489.1 hypothetical protein Psi01_61190 [Planobispora siamensis]